MKAYFLRRLLLMIPTFLGITILVFGILQFVPGGPVEQAIMEIKQASAASEGGGGGANLGVEISADAKERLNKMYGFDKPVHVRYALWLSKLVRLDLGESYKYREPVIDVIVARFPVSIYFGLIGFTLAYLVCVPLGVMKAIKHGSTFDAVSSGIVLAGYSIPGWALGGILLVVFGGGSFLDVFPLGGFRSANWDDLSLGAKITDQVHHTFLPVLAYMVGSFATLTVLMKNSLMENMGQDYVRTAFAKGLTEKRVLFVHALRNSLIPIATGLGHAISLVMAGSILIELVFNINGIGKLSYTAILGRDYTLVMGLLVINTLLYLTGNIISDFLYTLIDPRIRFK